MFKKWFAVLTAVFMFYFLYPSTVPAQDTTENSFDYGLTLRLRQEYWKNVFDLNNHGSKSDDDITRIKASLWGQWNINKDIDAYIKFTGEPWYYWGTHNGNDWVKEEVIIDNLYMDFKKPFDLPVNFRIGRQDFLFTYGEGFLIMDGTPGDGSRSFYFNAIKSSWLINDRNTLDLVYINDPYYDKYLPIVNDVNVKLNYADEQGVVLYLKSKVTDKLTLEPYYIYKQEAAIDSTSSDLDIHTIGAHAVYKMDPWKFHGEFAHQFGEYGNGTNRDANGGYIFADYNFKDVTLTPEVSAGFVYLSGDDPSTKTNEDWDPLFSRWPWLSELWILQTVTEKKIPGYWTNLQVYRTSLKLNITDKTNVNFRYNYLRANEDSGITGSIFSNDGLERGHLPQFQINHKFTKNIDGYFLLEYFIPGNYYVNTADDALFARVELQFKF